MAIERYTKVVAARNDAGCMRFVSQAFPQSVSYSPDGSQCLSHLSPPAWSKYVAGVLSEFVKLGFAFPALDFQIESDVPLGAGVSSSAALEVAMAMVLQNIAGSGLAGLEIAQLCQRAEHLHVGMPCGLMDQLASVSGRAGEVMLLDCQTNTIEQIPFSEEVAILVIDSRATHDLAAGEYQVRRQQCEAACQMLGVPSLRDANQELLAAHQKAMPDLIFRRALHIIGENERTVEMAYCVRNRNWESAGQWMYASHESMRSHFEITTPEIDCLVNIAKSLGVEQGVYGARMTGGGFGGCTIQLVDAKQADAIKDLIIRAYKNEIGIMAEGFVTRPADGALAMLKNV
jgi:galactokinase